MSIHDAEISNFCTIWFTKRKGNSKSNLFLKFLGEAFEIVEEVNGTPQD